jgi:hypothetical protein
MRSALGTLWLAGTCLLSLSCFSREPYPSHWAELLAAPSGACAEISGAYYNSCTPSSGSSNCLAEGGLAALLFRKYPATFHPKLATVNRVTIEQPSSRHLVVKAWQGSMLLRVEEIALAARECSRNGILIRGGPTFANIENAAGYGSSSVHFRKDANGDLVAWVHFHFTGIVLLVPASVTGTTWYRFAVHPNTRVTKPGEPPPGQRAFRSPD